MENGADANFMTAENERAIDLVDPDDSRLICLLLKFMNKTIFNDEQNELFDEMETIFLYKRLFINILKSSSDTENSINELEVNLFKMIFFDNFL